MKIRFIFIFLVAVISDAAAQNGNYSLSHFSPLQERADYLSFDLAQDERGIIYIAGKEGVEEFDGRSWRLIPTPGVAYTLAKTSKSVVVGGLNGFGQLINSSQNGWNYEPLSTEATAKNIFASLVLKDDVFFLNDSYVFVTSTINNNTSQTIKAPAGIELTGIFEIMNKVYVTSADKQIFKIDNGKLTTSDFAIPNEQILFVEKHDNTDSYLIGTASNHLFHYKGGNGLSEIAVVDSAYLNSHIVSNGVWLNDQVIAVGTIRGGVVFINVITGATEEIIDYKTGLPDNEVFALLCDKRQGIWVAHSYGYTRIATNVPFRSYSHYKGLSGNLLTVQSIEGNLYAGTSVGLFLLTQEEVYEDEIYYVTTKTKPSRKAEIQQPILEQTVPEERQRAKRGMFGSSKKEQKKAETKGASSQSSAVLPKTITSRNQSENLSYITRREKRIRKILRSVNYTFKQVDGIEGKVTQLWNWNGTLIAAGPSGLYEVIGDNAILISEDPIRSFTITKDGVMLVAATYDDEVRTFLADGKKWNRTSLLDTLHTFVSFLFEDKQQNLWLCGLNAIYKAEIAEGELVDIVKIPFSNPTMAETFGMAAGSDVLVMIAGKFLRYDFGKDKFIPYDSLDASGKSLVSGNRFWYFSGHKEGHRWGSPDQKLDKKFKLQWLNLFPDLRFISPDDKNENLWVITSANELYKFTSDAILSDAYQYPLFLKDVRNPQSKLAYTSQQVTLNQELGGVTFEFIQPEYSGLQTTEYRYWVKGLQKEWSLWSSLNNEISFPFLPVGTYKVMLQSRNLFGTVAEVKPLTFVVVPPYWKKTWFYALEVAFFSILVILSIQLSAMNERYQIVSRLFSLLTVIMLIQLIQTAVYTTMASYSLIDVRSSPVVDFFIQVSIALLVLPLEGGLRKLISNTASGKFSLSKLMGIRKLMRRGS